MLHLHFSNRLEPLRTLLLQRLREADAGVFSAQQVIVPHAAMRRHLSLAIADAQGICANVQFDFLAQWLWRQIARVVPGVADSSPFAASRLLWRVFDAFGDAAFVAAQPRLAAYLSDADPVLRHELATRVAALLESYVTYRADWLRAWRDERSALPAGATSEDEAWQAALWRRIDAQMGQQAQHPAQAFVETLARGGDALARRAGLPRCAHVFALPGIAPLHLQLLHRLSEWVELHLYVLNPCREYWFDLVDRRRLSHLAATGRAAAHEEGHRLLTSWGKATQAHVESLVELLGEGADDDALFEPAGGANQLQRLQDSLLDLQPLEPGALADVAGDRSIELHVCHSLTRELEVLQDHLLGLFANVPGTQPGDILVLLPDLDRAAPLIDAVFGTAPPERFIPYAIAGRSRSGQNPSARALLSLLALADSRCTASEVFALLQQPIVARRFGLDDAALALLHGWLCDAGFHWALDAQHLAGFDLPATPRHTLDDALQRLFLGHALPEGADAPFEGLLGAGNAEGSRALALGAFWQFASALQALQRELQAARSPADWAATLAGLIERFTLADDEQLDDQHELLSTIRQLVADMHGGGLEQPLPLSVLRAALRQQLDDPARSGAGGGSLSFASMSSQRGLPSPVLCVLGLNDGDFPGNSVPLEFDLMAQQPRRGDRQRRLEDRALMLDLVLAARQQLYLSHTGRSVRDNTPLPPSVLVAELLDLLLPAITAAPADATARQAARDSLVVAHPLQPFSSDVFRVDGDVRLRSYNAELAEALQERRGVSVADVAEPQAEDDDQTDGDDILALAPAAPFFSLPLPAPEPAWRQPSLTQLIAFFRNPARQLLRQRLGMALPREAEELQDDESFVPDALARSALASRLLPTLLRSGDSSTLPALARAGTELPAGALGERELQRELHRLQQFAERVRAASTEAVLPPHSQDIAVSIDGETWVLQCSFATLRAGGQLGWRYGDSRAGDYLEAWLRHLALCAAGPAGAAPHTRWLSADGEFAFAHCDDAVAQLTALAAAVSPGFERTVALLPAQRLALRARRPHQGARRLARDTRAALRRGGRPGLPPGAAWSRRAAGQCLRGAGRGGLSPAAGVHRRHEAAAMNADAFDVYGCELRGTRLVEASAGTGKTWALCGLYLRLLLEQQRPVQSILVVTFTNAATAELRERIRARIAETLARLRGAAPAGADPLVDKLLQGLRQQPALADDTMVQRLELALHSFDEASIFTIHGFCQRALADMPFAAGQPMALSLLADDTELKLQVAQDFWRRRIAGAALSPALADHLLDRGDTPDTLRQLLARRLAKPLARLCWPPGLDDAPLPPSDDTLLAAHASARATWAAERAAVIDIVNEALPRLNGVTYKPASVATACASWDELFARNDGLGSLQGLDKLDLLSAARLVPKKGQASPAAHAFFDQAAALLALHAARDEALALQRLRLLRDWLDSGPQALREAKHALRVIAFDDMLANLHRRLAAPGGAALAALLRQRFGAALIDEFQDTDPLQYAIFDAIYTGSDAPVCLVGDPKQAIYSFRHADLHTYLRAKARAGAHSTLADNQRSSHELLAAQNALFSANPDAFMLDGLRYQPVAFGDKPRTPFLDHSAEARAALQLWQLPRDDDDQPLPKALAAQAALRACAGEIVRLISAGRAGEIRLGERELRAGDIAVLVRSHAHGSAMRRALAQLGVASVELSQASIYDSAEAADLERLLAALLEPTRAPLLRAALATELMGLDAAALQAVSLDEAALLEWVHRFAAHRDTWMQRGVAPMLRRWMRAEGVSRTAAGTRRRRAPADQPAASDRMPERSRARPPRARGLAALAAGAAARASARRRRATAAGIRPRPGAGGDGPQVQGPGVPGGVLPAAVGRPPRPPHAGRRPGVSRRRRQRGTRLPHARQGREAAHRRADSRCSATPRRCA